MFNICSWGAGETDALAEGILDTFLVPAACIA
jgi:hypothetical protein